MLRLLLSSFSTKVLSAVFSVVVVLLTTNYLGTSGRGEIALITASINLLILLHCFVGSSAVVYLTPKRNFYQLLFPSYTWAIISSVGCYFVFQLIEGDAYTAFFLGKVAGKIHLSLLLHVVVLSFLGAIFEMNARVFLGKEKIITHNVVSLLRIAFLMVSLGIMFFNGAVSITSFILAMYICYGIGLAISFVCFLSFEDEFKIAGWQSSMKDMLNYGSQDQVSVVLHFLNYRLATYALFFLSGTVDTGIFSVVTFLMEGVLMISNSFSLVQYSKVVNSEDQGYNHHLTMVLFKMTTVILVSACVAISLIPSEVYEAIVGKKFIGLNYYFALISPGVIAFGSTVFFNNYFCSIGKFYHNILSNVFGLIVSLVGCFYIIPIYGIEGGCLVISITYIIVGIYLFVYYLKETNTPFKELYFRRSDWGELKKLLKQ